MACSIQPVSRVTLVSLHMECFTLIFKPITSYQLSQFVSDNPVTFENRYDQIKPSTGLNHSVFQSSYKTISKIYQHEGYLSMQLSLTNII